MLFACSCQHMLNTFPFIQRTEQVLIELDISAIEEYVIIIIIKKITISLTKLDITKYNPYNQEAIIHKHSPNQQQIYQWS